MKVTVDTEAAISLRLLRKEKEPLVTCGALVWVEVVIQTIGALLLLGKVLGKGTFGNGCSSCFLEYSLSVL